MMQCGTIDRTNPQSQHPHGICMGCPLQKTALTDWQQPRRAQPTITSSLTSYELCVAKKKLSEGKHSKLMLRSSRMEAKKPYSKIRGKYPMSIWLRNLGELWLQIDSWFVNQCPGEIDEIWTCNFRHDRQCSNQLNYNPTGVVPNPPLT